MNCSRATDITKDLEGKKPLTYDKTTLVSQQMLSALACVRFAETGAELGSQQSTAVVFDNEYNNDYKPIS
jgi:hypothetical protein